MAATASRNNNCAPDNPTEMRANSGGRGVVVFHTSASPTRPHGDTTIAVDNESHYTAFGTINIKIRRSTSSVFVTPAATPSTPSCYTSAANNVAATTGATTPATAAAAPAETTELTDADLRRCPTTLQRPSRVSHTLLATAAAMLKVFGLSSLTRRAKNKGSKVHHNQTMHVRSLASVFSC